MAASRNSNASLNNHANSIADTAIDLTASSQPTPHQALNRSVVSASAYPASYSSIEVEANASLSDEQLEIKDIQFNIKALKEKMFTLGINIPSQENKQKENLEDIAAKSITHKKYKTFILKLCNLELQLKKSFYKFSIDRFETFCESKMNLFLELDKRTYKYSIKIDLLTTTLQELKALFQELEFSHDGITLGNKKDKALYSAIYHSVLLAGLFILYQKQQIQLIVDVFISQGYLTASNTKVNFSEYKDKEFISLFVENSEANHKKKRNRNINPKFHQSSAMHSFFNKSEQFACAFLRPNHSHVKPQSEAAAANLSVMLNSLPSLEASSSSSSSSSSYFNLPPSFPCFNLITKKSEPIKIFMQFCRDKMNLLTDINKRGFEDWEKIHLTGLSLQEAKELYTKLEIDDAQDKLILEKTYNAVLLKAFHTLYQEGSSDSIVQFLHAKYHVVTSSELEFSGYDQLFIVEIKDQITKIDNEHLRMRLN